MDQRAKAGVNAVQTLGQPPAFLLEPLALARHLRQAQDGLGCILRTAGPASRPPHVFEPLHVSSTGSTCIVRMASATISRAAIHSRSGQPADQGSSTSTQA